MAKHIIIDIYILSLTNRRSARKSKKQKQRPKNSNHDSSSRPEAKGYKNRRQKRQYAGTETIGKWLLSSYLGASIIFNQHVSYFLSKHFRIKNLPFNVENETWLEIQQIPSISFKEDGPLIKMALVILSRITGSALKHCITHPHKQTGFFGYLSKFH